MAKKIPDSIWTVTTIRLRGERRLCSRTWGYYFSKDDAIEGMHRCCDTEAGYYQYTIIENFAPGIYAMAKTELWFMWDSEWQSCDKPESEISTVNYAIG